MAKFNEVQKRRRSQIAEKKRQAHGDPITGKLKVKTQPLSISGKRKRKLLKQWRRHQKDALQQGLISTDDIQMSPKIHLNKNKNKNNNKNNKIKIHTSIKIKAKGKKNKTKSDVPAADISTDAMVE